MTAVDLRNLDLNVLLVLDGLLRDNNLSSVARKLSISQPTASYSLRKLRDIFDDELFVRTGGRMQPTAKAHALRAPLGRVIDILRNELLNQPAFDPASSRRVFVINTTDIGEMVFLPSILRLLREFAPHASVKCVCLEPLELNEAMNDGKVDLAIGYLPELTGGAIRVQSFFDHPFVCLVRDDHPTIGKKLTLRQYAEARHIGLVGEGHSQKKFETMIKKAGIGRNIAFRSQHFMNIPFIVRDSDLVATVPKVIAVAFENLPGLRALWPPFAIPRIPIKQYWHQKVANDPAQIWLRKTTGKLFLNNDPTRHFQIDGQRLGRLR
ncbi:LysR family transcriptional regulator [Bradyrhizobium manausense]|uniref:LysR family transcriptional regulator n=1 Tax=Bradyrhizobium TaxID=374 RepID=UPI001BAC09BD|nr:MULTISPECIES: LysR family transcriptional regulator [Bradyrhizobium]MBR0824033.1 LysR family transcriptional regulator [Bradyrhizobium manausense]UVO26447.1 LysR family transcriptional regulator [Bradyrhizobium arachidis]